MVDEVADEFGGGFAEIYVVVGEGLEEHLEVVGVEGLEDFELEGGVLEEVAGWRGRYLVSFFMY